MPKAPSTSQLFNQAEQLEIRIQTLRDELSETYLQISKGTCPYKAGQTVWTSVGLGKQGLVIQSIISPKMITPENRWALDTFALSKSGELTRRAVLLEETDLPTIVEVK